MGCGADLSHPRSSASSSRYSSSRHPARQAGSPLVVASVRAEWTAAELSGLGRRGRDRSDHRQLMACLQRNCRWAQGRLAGTRSQTERKSVHGVEERPTPAEKS